nr:hypothetical protein [Tolivirales sp.]
MAKTKSKQNGKTKKVVARVPRPVGTPRFNLPAAATAYAKLLADPCNASLVAAPIGDGGGSLVVRMETDFLTGQGAGATATAIMWAPSMPGCYYTNVSLPTDGTAFTWQTATPTNAFIPGIDFLNNNAGQFRCISGCMQVYWPGSELNRQGIISMSRVGAELPATNTVTAYRSTAQYIERTPEGFAEIVWRPNDADLLFSEPGAEDSASATGQKRSALVVTAAGLPAATGIRVRIVACYEYIPKVSSGLKLSSRGHYGGITLGSVLNTLDRTGDWMYNTAHQTGRALSSIAGGVGGILSVGAGASRLGALMLAG